MKINTVRFNTYPNNKDHFWQIVLFPTISVLNNINKYDRHIAINFEWFFWSITFIITYGKSFKEPISYFKR